MVIVYIGTGYIQMLYLGRAPRTKETLPDFHEWRRVTRHPLVFRRLTGSQRTPGNWGIIETIFWPFPSERMGIKPYKLYGGAIRWRGKHCKHPRNLS